MITTTDAPPWLRRSDQAVTWARTMLTPHRAVVIDCETTDLPGRLLATSAIRTCRIGARSGSAPLARSIASERLSVICRMRTAPNRSPSTA